MKNNIKNEDQQEQQLANHNRMLSIHDVEKENRRNKRSKQGYKSH